MARAVKGRGAGTATRGQGDTGVTGDAADDVANTIAEGVQGVDFIDTSAVLRRIINDARARDADRIAASRALAHIEAVSQGRERGAGSLTRADLLSEIARIRAMLHD